MQSKKLVIMLFAAILLFFAARWLYQSQYQTSSSADWRGRTVFANLRNVVEQIARVELERRDDSLILNRAPGGEWTIASRDNYPADPNRVNELVFNLTEMQIADRITADAERYGNFGVSDPPENEGSLTLRDAEGGVLAHIIMGKRREMEASADQPMRAVGSYFRQPDDPAVYVTNHTAIWTLETQPSGWANTRIFTTNTDDIIDLRIDTPTSGSIRMAWDDGALALEEIPSGMQQRDAAIRDTRSALGTIRFTDVYPVGDEAVGHVDIDSILTVTTRQGSIYTFHGARSDDRTYIAMSAGYGEPFFTDLDQATTVTLAAARQEADAAREAVADFNNRQSNWIYEINSWIYQRLFQPPEAFLEPIPDAEADLPEVH